MLRRAGLFASLVCVVIAFLTFITRVPPLQASEKEASNYLRLSPSDFSSFELCDFDGGDPDLETVTHFARLIKFREISSHYFHLAVSSIGIIDTAQIPPGITVLII